MYNQNNLYNYVSITTLAFKYQQKFCKLWLDTLYLTTKHMYLGIYFSLVLVRVTIIFQII